MHIAYGLHKVNDHQLSVFCEVADRGFNLSATAIALRTSQPSISRQLQALEHELGISLFVRTKRRVTGLTGPGAEALRIARKMVGNAGDLRQIVAGFGERSRGELTVAASHTYAKYILPRVVQQFIKSHPNVKLVLLQGNPTQTAAWIISGEANVSIAPEPIKPVQTIAFLPCCEHHRIILASRSHDLAGIKRLTLEKLSHYPLITYGAEFVAYSQITHAFRQKGLVPNIVLRATDVDVMKTYVKCGLGVAIVASIAYDPAEDRLLRRIEAKHLFESNTIFVGLNRNRYQQAFVYDFIRLFAPQLQRAKIERAILGNA